MHRSLVSFALICIAPLLGACGGVHNQPRERAQPNVAPTNYKADIQAFLRTYLNDPTNIRGAYVAEPSLVQMGDVQRYVSCLRFNARKSNGEYEGSRDRLVVFLAGRLDTMLMARPEQCATAAFQPFPELERITR